jgi:hypothetical protein
MTDVHHNWGDDLSWSATGDLLGVAAADAGKQRVLRRLLTAEGEYIWHPDYGAGLPGRVGSTDGAAEIEGVARRQMLMEQAVSQNPMPTVEASGQYGAVGVRITYQDAETAEPVGIGFTIQD